MQMPGTGLSDVVTLPTKAGGWEVTRTRNNAKDDDITVTASRSFAGGVPVRNDLGLKDADSKAASGAKLLLDNTAAVRRTADGSLELRETLHYLGKSEQGVGQASPQIVAAVKNALPPALQADAASERKAALQIQAKLWQALMGPSDPVLPTLLFHPDYATYGLDEQLRGGITDTLTEVYGERLSASDRARMAEGMVKTATSEAVTQTNRKKEAQTPGGSGRDKGGLPVPPLFRLKMPGKVTQTNGRVDPATGEVFWPLYSESAAAGDITLSATCKAGQ